MDVILHSLTDFLEFFKDNLPTMIFLVLFVLFVSALARLHFSAQYKNFDLATMFTNRDGGLDMGKLRVTTAFFATTYAFFYVMIKHPELFISYAATYIAVWLTHQVADKMTRTDKDKLEDAGMPNSDPDAVKIVLKNAEPKAQQEAEPAATPAPKVDPDDPVQPGEPGPAH